jgi:hypothetical protein
MKIDKWVVQTSLYSTFLSLCIVTLPGCNPLDLIRSMFEEKKTTPRQTYEPQNGSSDTPSITQKRIVDPNDTVIVSMNGEPLVTQQDLDREFEILLNDNPQLKQVLPFIPEAKTNLLEGLTKQAIVDRYVEENNIDKQVEYQQELDKTLTSVRRMLNTKYIQNELDVNISDKDVRTFYDTNKETMPDLLISRGGIQTKGISFDTEQSAQDFLNRAKNLGFEKAAEQNNLTKKIQDFKFVNEQSLGINDNLKKAILKITSVPTIRMYKVDDKTFWIYFASNKKDPEYRPFDQIKPALTQFVEREKKMEKFNEKVDALKEEYNVVINEKALEALKQKSASQKLPVNNQ